MSHPAEPQPSGEGPTHSRESEIIEAYSLNETMGAQQPPSYTTDDSIFAEKATQQSTPLPAPAVTSEPLGGLAQPADAPRSSTDDAFSRSSSSMRRVRWGEEQPIRNMRSTKIEVQPQGRGPTISVKPTSAPRDDEMPASPTGTSGIKRLNHPGQISLEGLRPNLPTETIPLQPMNHASTPGQTNALGLEGEDNDRFLALSRELNELDQTNEADISDERGAMAPPDASQDALYPSHDRSSEQARLMSLDFGPRTPGSTSGSSADGSTDMEHVDLIEGEIDGMPSRTKRRRPSRARGWARVRQMLGVDHSDVESMDTMEKGKHPGATNTKTVLVETSTGLRGAHGRHRPSALERKAAKLVRAHKMLNGHGPTTPDPEDLLHVKHDHLPDSEASTPDALETAQHMDARPAPSTGVLGQLLQLYEQQRLDQEAANSASGMTPSATGSDTEGTDVFTGNHAPASDTAGLTPGAHDPLGQLSPGIQTPNGMHRKNYLSGRPASGSSPRGGIGGFASANLTNVGHISQKIVKNVANEAGLDVMDERPKAARSAAGTIGALIATSGNLIGAVSPSHAQLGPNPKRPGYTLDRYLLPEMNEKTLKRTAKIVRDAAPVPKSMRDTRPPGPRTPGAWTPGGSVSQADESFNPYFAAATPNEKSSNASFVSSANQKSSRMGSEAHSHASNRMSMLGMAGKHMLRGSLRPVPGSAGSDSAPGQGDYFGDMEKQEQVAKQEWQRKLRKRKARSKKQEIYITMHVAAILKRQEFLLKFGRAMMMFGAPTHRIETQMQQTANVLDVNCRCIYLPNLMLLSFGDDATHTTDTKFIKQGSVLDLTKLTDMHSIYWNVIHDKIGVERATKQLDVLMRRKPYLRKWQQTLIGAFASFFICLGKAGFNGSLLDACAAFVLGGFLVLCQQQITSELYSSVFEIVFATINSFIAMALHIAPHGGKQSESWRGELFCYQSIISGSIVLILPGFIVLTAALELQSKSIISGSVRLVYAIIYSVLLGLGIKFGSIPLSASRVSEDGNYSVQRCFGHDSHEHWYTSTLPIQWAFLTVPGYSLMLALRNQGKVTRKEFPVMILIACAGWVVANFAQLADQSDMINYLKKQISLVAAMGSFVVGILANLYGRLFDGRSFVVAVPGILFQLPTGLTPGGGPTFVSYANSNSNSTGSHTSAPQSGSSSEVMDGLQIGAQLLNVSLGIAIGLFTATILMHLIGGNRVRGGGMFSF